jgi:hypothetical protein
MNECLTPQISSCDAETRCHTSPPKDTLSILYHTPAWPYPGLVLRLYVLQCKHKTLYRLIESESIPSFPKRLIITMPAKKYKVPPIYTSPPTHPSLELTRPRLHQKTPKGN